MFESEREDPLFKAQSDVGALLFKLERAHRGETGTYVTAAELALLAEVGVLRLLEYAAAGEILTDLEREARAKA